MTNATISNQRIGSWANSFEVYRSLLDECFCTIDPKVYIREGTSPLHNTIHITSMSLAIRNL